MHKMFQSITRRAITHPRFLEQVSRRLLTKPCFQNIFSSRGFWRVCSYSGSCSIGNDRDKHRLQVTAGQKHFPQIILTLSYSLERQNKPNAVNEIPAKSLNKKDESTTIEPEDEKNLSIFKRFKKMYRDYWYVLVPVHVITSLGWFGGFYYLAESGVDIISLAEIMGVSEHVPAILKDSSAGYFAISYALYKIATPVRYMLTIGGTTLSINYLKNLGYIKPIPPKAKLKEMYQERKENLKEKRQHFADELKQKKDQLKERGQTLIRERRKQTKK